MTRSRLSLFLFVLTVAALPLRAQQRPCNLEISLTCTTGQCTSTTINAGPNSCGGDYIAAFFSETPKVSFSGMTTTLGLPQCFDTSTFPIEGAGAFAICFGSANLAPGASFSATAAVGAVGATLPSLSIIGETVVLDGNGDELAFVYAFNDVRLPSCTPTASVAPVTLTGVPYTVSWTAVSQQQATYVVEESTAADF